MKSLLFVENSWSNIVLHNGVWSRLALLFVLPVALGHNLRKPSLLSLLRADSKDHVAFGSGAIVATELSTTIVNGSIGATELGTGIDHPLVLPIELGGQKLNVLIDTGSFSFIVSSKTCKSSVCPTRAFDPAASQHYQSLGRTKHIKYLSGRVSLEEARDVVELENRSSQQTFWEVVDLDSAMHSLWEKSKMDGILGLTWLKKAPIYDEDGGNGEEAETTLLESFGVQAFTTCFGKSTSLPNYGGVELTPSFIYWSPPQALAWGSTTKYADVVGNDHWSVVLDEVAIVPRNASSAKQTFACHGGGVTGPCLALLDSGCGTIQTPIQHMVSLLQLIGRTAADGIVDFDCTNLETLPDIVLKISGIELVLPPETYVGHHYLGSTGACMSLIEGFPPTQIDGRFLWILGLPLFRQYVLEFDRTHVPPRVGFAEHPGAEPQREGECPQNPPVAA